MNKSEFDKLLERYVTGHVSEQERQKIEAWLEVMKTENINESDFSARDEEKLFHRITANTTGISDVIEFRPGAHPSTRIWKIAASLLILAALSFAVWWGVSPQAAALSG